MTARAPDPRLVYFLKRKPRKNSLPPEACIAINLFVRRGWKIPVLAKAFGVARNTIYYRILTGDAPSYPNSIYSNSARDTNDLIDAIGENVAWRDYVTPAMVEAVEAAGRSELERRKAA